MKVNVKDLGILKQAEFEVGDLTIVCGANNTGKTYAAYALYGFLTFWNESFSHSFIGENELAKLLKQGSIVVDLDEIKKTAHSIVDRACDDYSLNLPNVFGASNKYFSNSSFKISLDIVDFIGIGRKIQTKSLEGKPICDIDKIHNESFLTITIIANSDEINSVNKNWFLYQINRDIQCVLFSSIIPEPFIASIERTGAAMFQKELDIYRNRLLEQVSNREKAINPIDLINAYFDDFDGRYALPVRRDVDFIRDLANVAKYDSNIEKENPFILEHFDLLAGGEYKASREGVHYIPNKSKAKLTMGESASSVRSLLNLGMYIRHIASPGDFLIIDEPELNLHPKNQRLMARLLAKLVNAGVRVFITTHSDYILKEFNTLIMLKNAGPGAIRIMEEYEYDERELLDTKKIKAYIAKNELIKIDELKTKRKFNTFVKAPIDVQGIEVAEFDETINIMNEIQETLLHSGYIL
ncbi:MAG: AAA family ATPase [Oscillospiraceae bacterium]|nr:AAA family ATPase [Oscillospiraceae bacterium]